MKRLLAFCLVLCLSLGLVACDKLPFINNAVEEDVVSSENERGENPSLVTSKTEQEENKQYTANGFPPLAENLQVMYQRAEEMVRAFTLCAFQTDGNQRVMIDGMDYNPIIDPRFQTYGELETYLGQLFTGEFINETLLSKDSCVKKAEDDVAVVIAASGSEDITYAGHVFRVTEKTDTKIVLVATAYFADDMYMENYFFTAPSNPEDFTTKEYTYQLDYTQNGWRFSKFPFMRG